MAQTPPRPVCRWLSFSSTDDNTPHTPRATPASTPEYSEDEEEDFQMVPLKDDQWTSEEIPERTLCIHEHGIPHGLCPYPCPYGNYQVPSYIDTLDLSDNLEFEDYMVTSNDKDIPALEDTPYWKKHLFALNITLHDFLLNSNIDTSQHALQMKSSLKWTFFPLNS